MSENLSTNGKNGNGAFNIPLALVLFIIMETGTGIWIMSSLNTKMEMMQQQLNSIPITNEQFRKDVSDKLEVQRMQIHKLDGENILIKTKVGIK